MPAEYVPTADQLTLAENSAAFGRPQWRQRTLSRLGFTQADIAEQLGIGEKTLRSIFGMS
jgi:hypothetical protein